MKLNVLGITAPKQNLARLVLIRWLLLLFILVGLAFSSIQLKLVLPYSALLAAVVVIILFNVVTSLRLRRPWPVTTEEFSFQILSDVLGVTVLFYFCGGASNPFVSYYLVPISIASATLAWRYTAGLTALSVVCYTLLLFYYVPIAALSPEMLPTNNEHIHAVGNKINPHILGMWFNFILSAALITFFVVRMSHALKQQQQKLNDYREDNLRDEQILAVATLAAGTAHELGSPLTTMKLLLNEIIHDTSILNNEINKSQLDKDLNLLASQVDLCSNTLKDLVEQADNGSQDKKKEKTISDYCKHVIDRWMLLRPDVIADISIQEDKKNRQINFHSAIEQAIINLLNNAADACLNKVIVEFTWDDEYLTIDVVDDGEGMSPDIKEQIGQPFISDKKKGLGLGLFLSNATIGRYGGTIKIVDEKPTGTRLKIVLPF